MNKTNNIFKFNIFANIFNIFANIFARYCGARVSQRFSASTRCDCRYVYDALFFIPCGVHRLAPDPCPFKTNV